MMLQNRSSLAASLVMQRLKTVFLLKQALINCLSSYNHSIRECISDHGLQFYGERRDKHGLADLAFENFEI